MTVHTQFKPTGLPPEIERDLAARAARPKAEGAQPQAQPVRTTIPPEERTTIPPEDKRAWDAPNRRWRWLTDAEIEARDQKAKGIKNTQAPATPSLIWAQSVAVPLAATGFTLKDGVAPAPENSWVPLDKVLGHYLGEKGEIAEAIGTLVAELGRELRLEWRKEMSEAYAKLRDENTELKITNERLRADMAGLKAKQGELDFVVERLRIDKRGPPGAKGLPGRDGEQGPEGPKGARGDAASRIVSWDIGDPNDFTAAPVMSNGSRGAPLQLRALLDAYNELPFEDEYAPPMIDVTPRARS